VGIADVFNIMGQWAFIRPIDAFTRSKAMLQKAMEIDSSLSEVYSSLGFMSMGYEWDFRAAEDYLRRSIELNPQNAIAHSWYGELLAIRGRKEEAIAEAKKAIECEPLFSLIHSLLGVILAMTGEVEAGREQLDKAISMNPDQPMPYLFQGMIYLISPSFPQRAIEYLKKPAEFGMIFSYGWLGAAYALSGQKEKTLEILEELDSIEKERYLSPIKKVGVYLKPGLRHFRFMKRKYVAPLTRFLAYLALNMQDKALAWLEKSAQERNYFFPALIMVMDRFDFKWTEEMEDHWQLRAYRKKIKFA
jgi:tetratricopeptide (TPR) repeat protein